MKLSSSQMNMALLLGRGNLPFYKGLSLEERIARGRIGLMDSTRRDFGYDVRAWHGHLLTTNADGYKTDGGHRKFGRRVEIAATDSQWQAAVERAEAGNLVEVIREARRREFQSQADGERAWSGKSRPCPRCGTQFVSVRNRGQCPACGKIFLASQPDASS